MADKKLVDKLFFRLTEEAVAALQTSVQQCKQRHSRYVEVQHWFYNLLQGHDSDLHRVLRHFDRSLTAVEEELNRAAKKPQSDYESSPSISPRVRALLREAWLQASIGGEDERIRSGHILLAALHDEEMRDALREASPTLASLPLEELDTAFASITEGSPEWKEKRVAPASQVQDPTLPAATSAALPSPEQGAIGRFTEDLSEKARLGRIDALSGREREVRQVEKILLKSRYNNPILTGEAGVGKTAIVERFAQRVASGDVSPPLKSVRVLSLDLTRLQAGAGVRGEFENRLKALLDEIKAAGNIILFIDEAHMLIGAGGTAGQGDAANLLKPALARGELRVIAATTADEYRKHIEEDQALKRRFQEVPINEPSEDDTIQMLRKLAASLEKHHRVVIFDEALAAAVRLSNRYLPARRLPEKAVAVLDTACSAVAFSQSSLPFPLEEMRRNIDALKSEIELLEKEILLGGTHQERVAKLRDRLKLAEARGAELDSQVKRESPLVQEIAALRDQLRSSLPTSDASERPARQQALRTAEAALRDIQKDEPLLLSGVNEQAIASVIEEATGIPAGRLAKNEIRAVLNLAQTLKQRVVGQDSALAILETEIRNAEARLKDPNKPIGAFLLVGPSGVGKTETALALAEARYGSERNMIVFNMNEFKEDYAVSTLLGSVPGTIMSDKGGQLSEAIRRRPYSVILLDEFEKAHKGIQEVFLQIIDQGWTKDRQGRFIDFRNSILLCTSNAGSEDTLAWCQDPEGPPTPAGLASALKDKLRGTFSDALLGRLTIVPYFPLDPTILSGVIVLKLGRLQKRLMDYHGIEMKWEEPVSKFIAERCTKLETGARLIDSFINANIVSELSRITLTQILEGKKIHRITIVATDGKLNFECS